MRDLGLTIIYVEDMDRAREFYSNVLELPLAVAVPGWAQFDTQGAALVLHPKASGGNDGRGGATHLAFRVDDVEAEYARLAAKGVRFISTPAAADFGKHATLADPEGNEIDLIEWQRPLTVPVTAHSVVNDIISGHPETMEVFEEHGIRICGGCLVLLNSPVYETAEYSGLDAEESAELVQELNHKLQTSAG